MYTISLFQNIWTPENPETISIDKYVKWVQEGINVPQITQARSYPRKSPSYNRVKDNRICVTHNFLFKERKNDRNIIASTGLLYYDIDPDMNFNISDVDKSKIFISHKSFGGDGNVIIVKADGITIDNFNTSYSAIAVDLGISRYMDPQAIKKTQFTVISYDPQIYFNPDSIVFSATLPTFGPIAFKNPPSVREIKKEEHLLLNGGFFNSYAYRITNASDYVENGREYQVFPEGIQTAKIHIPRNVPIGKRSKTLYAIAQNTAALNNISYENLLYKMRDANNICNVEPLPDNEVIGIVNSIMSYKKNKTLKPINNTTRKVIFKNGSGLSREEKVSIVNKEVGKMKVMKTKQKIHDAIVQWYKPQKITVAKISLEIGMGLRTVERYWGAFKDFADEHNARLKGNAEHV
jgi:hypothetical protein